MEKKFKLPISGDTYVDFKAFYVNNNDGIGCRSVHEIKADKVTERCMSVPWTTRGNGLILLVYGETTDEECYLTIGFHKGEVFLNAYKKEIKQIPIEQMIEKA